MSDHQTEHDTGATSATPDSALEKAAYETPFIQVLSINDATRDEDNPGTGGDLPGS